VVREEAMLETEVGRLILQEEVAEEHRYQLREEESDLTVGQHLAGPDFLAADLAEGLLDLTQGFYYHPFRQAFIHD
tara:strand:- start:20 stop:247 length:228 start_codon:yes stop_codon:yes gene_type:complete